MLEVWRCSVWSVPEILSSGVGTVSKVWRFGVGSVSKVDSSGVKCSIVAVRISVFVATLYVLLYCMSEMYVLCCNAVYFVHT